MNPTPNNRKVINKSLRIFFMDALKIVIKNPLQAFSFFRTLLWLGKAARLRSHWLNQGINVPPIIIFSITNECNLNCLGCYAKSLHPGSGEELSSESMKRIFKEANELGVSFFVIAGGEPLMRPEIMDITKNYREIIFLIFTNGLLIDDEMILKFKKQKNVVPLISLEGNREDTDQRRGEGTHSHLHNTMKEMKQKGIFFGNSLTLTRANFSTIMDEQYIKNLVDSGCKFFLFLEYTPTVEGTEGLVLTQEQRQKVAKLLNTYRLRYPSLFIAVPWDEDDVGGCLSAGRGFVHINAAGDLEPCPFAPFSDTNLKNTPLKEALLSKLLISIRQRPELAKETGEGCILWKERELVKELLKAEKIKN